MCGIVGVLSTQPVDPSRLESALESMQARGPDQRGRWWSADRATGLGHCRLSINDPEGGQQPMLTGPNERHVSVVNGEFYGSPNLGYDSLQLPRALEAHSPAAAISSLRGEFAFLHFDRQSKVLTVARDRFGIKPLFWAPRDHELWFASKASALWAAGVKADWCGKAFWRAASTQYPPLHSSAFEGIRNFPPAHWTCLRAGESVRYSRYWQIPSWQGKQPISDTEFLTNLRESIQLRVRTSQKTAVQLSGGIDSAAVLALAREFGALHAFTVDFSGGPRSFSEAKRAQEICEHLDIPHTILKLTPEELVGGFREAVQRTEGFMVNGHGVAKLRLAEAIHREGIKVCLSGEGSDELLFGYRHFRSLLGRDIVDPLEDPAGLGILTSSANPPLSSRVQNQLGASQTFLNSKFALGQKIKSLLCPEFVAQCQERDPIDEDLADQYPNSQYSPVERIRDLWVQTALRSYILETLGDGTEMSHSVEGRPPFLDHKLWECMADHSIETVRGDKRLLRESMRGHIPESVLSAPKHPFMAPPLGPSLQAALLECAKTISHKFVDDVRLAERLSRLDKLPLAKQWEWEPALCWLLSSFHLQELWRSS